MFARRILIFTFCLLCLSGSLTAASYDGVLTINVAEEGTGTPLPVRMELTRSGRPVRVRPEGAVVVDGYLVFEGSMTLELKKGNYEFSLDAGPEFQTRQGHFSIERHAEDSTDVTLARRVKMQSEGWWAGDLDVSQKYGDMPLLMRAAGVDFAPLTIQENRQGKCVKLRQPPAAEISEFTTPLFGPWSMIDNRPGQGLIMLGSALPEVCSLAADESLLTDEDAENTFVALTPFAWQLPVWVAAGKLDAVQIIHRHALLDKSIDKEDNGYPRDPRFYPGDMGNGRWSEAIYHHLLNCGLRIPPAAGSGSGTNGNPVGTNRVYAYCGERCTRETWLSALKAGKVMVTNGPLLRTTVEGYAPGHVFSLEPGEEREFQIALSLTFYEKAAVEYLEILKNGEVAHQIRLRDLAAQQGRLPTLKFKESGWFAVRAMTGNTKNYQYATTGPYYVEQDGQLRISRRSVQFFLDWLAAAKKEFADDKVNQSKLGDASAFWEDLHAQANAE